MVLLFYFGNTLMSSRVIFECIIFVDDVILFMCLLTVFILYSYIFDIFSKVNLTFATFEILLDLMAKISSYLATRTCH